MKKRRKIGSQSNQKFFNDLEKDITVFKKKVLINCARIASGVLEDEYLTIMDMFYEDYSPIFYDRTYGVKYDTYERYYKNTGKSYRGGIALSAQNMNQDDYRAETEYIFDISVIKGWHGDDSIFVSSPSPFDSIRIFRDSLVRDMNMGRDSYGIQQTAFDLALDSYRGFIRGGR